MGKQTPIFEKPKDRLIRQLLTSLKDFTGQREDEAHVIEAVDAFIAGKRDLPHGMLGTIVCAHLEDIEMMSGEKIQELIGED